ncbi:hypothetical protein N9948_01760 [bacterium]|nr:hypothetical protein [bacterium]
MENKVATISSIIALFSSVFAGVQWIDGRYAKNEDLAKVRIISRLNQIEITKVKVISIKHANHKAKAATINDVLKQLEDEALFLRQKMNDD